MEEVILRLNWHGVAFILSAFGAYTGGLLAAIWWLVRREIRHNDERFTALEGADAALSRAAQNNERAILELKADLPTKYVQREDWIRFSGTLEFKLDAVHRRIDELRKDLRGSHHA